MTSDMPADDGIDALITQMSRGSVLSGWDVVINIDEGLVNQIFQAQFNQSAKPDWKEITIAFCQVFPNPGAGGQLAVYTGVNISLASPSLTFLGDNQAFVDVLFKASGRTGTAVKVVPSGFDPSTDADPSDPTLAWKYTAFSEIQFAGQVPLSMVHGSVVGQGDVTDFVLDFRAGSFTSPLLAAVKDPPALQLQLSQYLQTHDVQYLIASIKRDVQEEIPQLMPSAFGLAVLTTNRGKNVFQLFIATQNPAPHNLTIGVNEPLPDGYGITAMFNADLAAQLQPTLMVQTWLFLQSNLTFPGRTLLSLGPELTPCDAVILGKLSVDTSSSLPPIPYPPIGNESEPMLNIQNTKQITVPGSVAFTAYGDDQDPNAWYIPPSVVWARDSVTQLPQFSMVTYRATGGGVSGFCRFSVQLMIDPLQAAALQRQIPGATTPQFDWVQSAAVFTYTIDGKSTSVSAQPSDFGSQTVTFAVPLVDQQAIAAFVNAFSPSGSGGGTYGISYDLAADTRLPAVTVVTQFDSTIAYQYQVQNKYAIVTTYHTDTWGNTTCDQEQVFVGTYVREMLQQSQAGTVKVTPGQGLTPALLTMVEDWAQTQLQNDVAQAINTALSLIQHPTNDFSMNNVASFTHTLSTSNVVPWYFTVNGTLPPFDAATWSKVSSTVDQQQLNVTFEIQAGLAQLGVERVNLTFKYGDVPPITHTFDTNDQSPWFVTMPGQLDAGQFVASYSYKYDVVYATPKGGSTPATLSTAWITDDSTSVKFGSVELGLMAVSFAARNLTWAAAKSGKSAPLGVKEITVDWNWIPQNGDPILSESLLLTEQKRQVTSTLRSVRPTTNQRYQYSLTFLMNDGTKLHANGLTGTQPRQYIDHPLSELEFSVLPMFPDDAKVVVLRATFDDELNDIHLSHAWQVVAGKGGAPGLSSASFEDWKFQAVVANANLATVVFSGQWVDAKGKQNTIPKTLLVGTNNTLIISDTQKTVTAVIDASNVAFVPPQTNGVYRVTALVASTTDSAATPSLANASTITFGQGQPAVQYYAAQGLAMKDTPTFVYNYEYTTIANDGGTTQVVDSWATPQSTVSTALPVIAGTAPAAPIKALVAVAGLAAAGAPALDPRTAALFARHDRFCATCEVVPEAASYVQQTAHV